MSREVRVLTVQASSSGINARDPWGKDQGGGTKGQLKTSSSNDFRIHGLSSAPHESALWMEKAWCIFKQVGLELRNSSLMACPSRAALYPLASLFHATVLTQELPDLRGSWPEKPYLLLKPLPPAYTYVFCLFLDWVISACAVSC